jgi:arabinofuranosyltransferase
MRMTLPERKRVHAALAVAVILLVTQIALFHALRHDDAYITFRYGQNLASGHGLVFNPGERVMGSTSPGQALVSAIVYAVCGMAATPSVMSALGCLGWTAQAAALFALLRGLLGEKGAAAIAVVVALGGAGSAQWVALETNLAAALALWAFFAALRDRWILSAVLAASAGLVRPDAMLLAVVLGPWCLRTAGVRTSIRALLAAIALLAPWLVVSTIYFGSPIPQSAVAKFHVTSLGDYLVHLVTHVGTSALPAGGSIVLVALVWALAVRGVRHLYRADRRLASLPAWGLLHAAAYLLLRPYTAHTWHLYPVVLVTLVCAWVAIVEMVSRVSAPPARLALSAVTGVLVLSYALRTWTVAAEFPTARWIGARDRTYRAVARHLVDHAAPGDVVAAVEVGTLGYFSRMPMHDLGGLVTRHPVLPGGSKRPYRWLVVDELYWRLAPRDQPVELEITEHGFPVRVLDLGPSGG